MENITYDSIDPVVTKHEPVEDGYCSVYVYDKNIDWGTWIDVDCTDPENITAEWNQYIFWENDAHDQRARQYQQNEVIIDLFLSEACNFAEKLIQSKKENRDD